MIGSFLWCLSCWYSVCNDCHPFQVNHVFEIIFYYLFGVNNQSMYCKIKHKLLPILHFLTQCDTTSYLYVVVKFTASVSFKAKHVELGDLVPGNPTERNYKQEVQFLCRLYKMPMVHRGVQFTQIAFRWQTTQRKFPKQ